jgi:hypothetical protein
MTRSDPFASPLRRRPGALFAGFDFGLVERSPAVERLADRLQAALDAVVERLPPALAAEAHALLDGYAGAGRRFIDLFYTPAWSFLHWAGMSGDEAAVRAHALAWFLHLWDDHLSDGQLAPDLLRIQLRSLAWSEYATAAQTLALRGGAVARTATLVDDYLESVHRPSPVSDLAGYCARFVRQMGIVRVVPSLAVARADELDATINAFTTAWRIVDDIQDATADLIAGHHSALYYAMSEDGRLGWDRCAAASASLDAPDPDALGALEPVLTAAARILALEASQLLAGAEEEARRCGWDGLALELAQAGRLQGLAALASG